MSTAERSLYLLEPATAKLVGEWLRLCSSKGVAVLIVESFRSPERQQELYERGRTVPGRRVTNAKAGYSYHQYGMAVDACPYQWLIEGDNPAPVSKIDWEPFVPGKGQAFRTSLETTRGGDLSYLDKGWTTMVQAADEVGLAWAGRWPRMIEYAHFQRADAPTIERLVSEVRRV